MARSAPWREPKLTLTSDASAVVELINSPRFRAASLRYGISHPESLMPQQEGSSPAGVEAAFYAKREKRRLIDLSAVLMERQLAIREGGRYDNAAATEISADAGPSHNASAPMLTDSRLNYATQHAELVVANEKRRARAEVMELIKEETQSALQRKEQVALHRASEAAAAQQHIDEDLRRRSSHKAFRDARDTYQERTLAAWDRASNDKREKMKKDQASRSAMRATRREEMRQEARRREREREDSLALHRGRATAQHQASQLKIEERANRRATQMAAWREMQEKLRKQPHVAGSKGKGDRVALLKQRFAKEHEQFRVTMENRNRRVYMAPTPLRASARMTRRRRACACKRCAC